MNGIRYGTQIEVSPTKIVFRCSDPRFDKSHDDFIEKELGLMAGKFVPITIFGGPAGFAHEHSVEYPLLRRSLLKALHTFPTIETIVIIAHQDCRWYKSDVGHLKYPGIEHRGEKDIPVIVGAIRHILAEVHGRSAIKIETYYGRGCDDKLDELEFVEVLLAA